MSNNNDDDAVTGELIPAPMLALSLDRTKRYVRQILYKLTPEDALKLLNDQVTIKNLLINDQVIKLLEELEMAPDLRSKAAIAVQIQALTAAAVQITNNKIALDAALGAKLLPHLPEATAEPARKEMSIDDFEAQYKKDAKDAGQLPSPHAGQA